MQFLTETNPAAVWFVTAIQIIAQTVQKVIRDLVAPDVRKFKTLYNESSKPAHSR